MSKEQSTESNPPMMLACGHVVTKDSLTKLNKPGGYATHKLNMFYRSLSVLVAGLNAHIVQRNQQ